MVVNMYLDVGAEGWEIEGAGRTGVRMVTVAGNGDCGAWWIIMYLDVGAESSEIEGAERTGCAWR